MGSRVAVVAALALAAATVATAAAAPKLRSAWVVGDRVTLDFSTPLALRGGRITVTVNGLVVAPARTIRMGRRLQLVLPKAAYSDDIVRVHGLGLRGRNGTRIRAFATTAASRTAAGCSFELGTIATGVPSEGPTDLKTFLAPGRLSVLSIEVDYADAPVGRYSPATAVPLPDSWLRDVSYGHASVTSTPHPGTVRMPKGFVDYAFRGSWGTRKPFFQDLLLRLDPEVDFSRYDAVFATTTVKPGNTQIAPAILAPVGDGLVADGKELRHFAVFRSSTDPGTILRSLLTLSGLPTLTDASAWDSIGLLAWHRRKLGWLDPSQTRCLRSGALETVLAPTWLSGGVKLVVAPVAAGRAIVLENRQSGGLDAHHCTRGILAYEVQTAVVPDPIKLLRAQPTSSCGSSSDAPFDFRPGDSTRVADAVTFEVLETLPDGSYRLRVTR